MKRVLFVCTGNTCRSCMAEGIGRKLLSGNKKYGSVQFLSAGLSVLPGDGASPQAIDVMKEYGVDLSAHRARKISRDMISSSDLILTMTGRHRDAVKRIAPEFEDRVFTLKEYASGIDGDITDPYGMSEETYSACAAELKNYILKALDRIV